LIKQIECKNALHKIKNDYLPQTYDLNIFRGCSHGCKYCYALYSHTYLDDKEYFENIYVKKDVVKVLEIELKKQKNKNDIVNLGGVTDSYQELEKTQKIMPEILKLFIKYKTPITISTKSDLILRDYDLIDELSRLTYVNIASTITIMDETKRAKIEPNAVNSKRRFEILKEFTATNASIGVHVMPIIPFLTDSYENLDEIFYLAKLSNVHYLLPSTLNLRGKTRDYFLNFLKKDFPHLSQIYLKLYQGGVLNQNYKNNLYKIVDELFKKYDISVNSSKLAEQKLKNHEPSLFDNLY
jgi:DNA repair photolyase